MSLTFKFNPAALLMHEPQSLHLEFRSTPVTGLSAYRARHSGMFLACGAEALVDARYARLRTGATYRQCLELQADEGLQLKHSFHVGKAREFLEHQLDAHLNPLGALGATAREAHVGFVQAATRLALALKPVLPSYAAGLKGNAPENCFGISSLQSGVFVWPSWRAQGEVHTVVSVRHEQDTTVREVLRHWLEREKLRVAPQASFS